jgi:hypothetical protein
MGIDLLDVAFRLERQFGVKVSPDQYSKMAMRNDPPDIRVGDLFDFIRGEVPLPGKGGPTRWRIRSASPGSARPALRAKATAHVVLDRARAACGLSVN